MWMMNDIRRVRYVGHYVVRLTFHDGLDGDVDLSSYLGKGPIFAPLAELSRATEQPNLRRSRHQRTHCEAPSHEHRDEAARALRGVVDAARARGWA
jgi:hypothetical protein